MTSFLFLDRFLEIPFLSWRIWFDVTGVFEFLCTNCIMFWIRVIFFPQQQMQCASKQYNYITRFYKTGLSYCLCFSSWCFLHPSGFFRYIRDCWDVSQTLDQGSPSSVLEGRCPADFSSNPNQTHLKQLIKVLLGILEASMQVCWGKLELNSAGHRPSRTEFDDPCFRLSPQCLVQIKAYSGQWPPTLIGSDRLIDMHGNQSQFIMFWCAI